jgi:hypothetical protein
VVNGHVPAILLYREKKIKREGGGALSFSQLTREGEGEGHKQDDSKKSVNLYLSFPLKIADLTL